MKLTLLALVAAVLAAAALAGTAKAHSALIVRAHVAGCWWVYTGTNCYWWTYWYVTCEDTYGWRGPGC